MSGSARVLLAWGLGCLACAARGGTTLPAFPGAEGYGAAAVGGRGGKVVHVTTLRDSGPGSFRAALEAKGPRIVVFDVGGTIELTRDLAMPNDNGRITVAGQTAPGGVTILGGGLGLPGWSRSGHGTPDIIVRHLRVRGVHNTAGPGQGGDAFNAYWARRVIVDHCSFTGACDETVDVIHSSDVTFQWCTIEEPALWGQGGAQHSEGNHNTGFISAYEPAGNISFHHNLVAHSPRRNPMIRCGPADVRNNVIYHFGTGLSGASRDGGGEFNVVGNYYRRGPQVPRSITPCYGLGGGRYYFHGNLFDLGEGARVAFGPPWDDLPKLQKRFRHVVFWGGGTKLDAPARTPPVATQSAAEAYELVLARAGAWPRDATTRRIVQEVKARTGSYGLNGPYERFPTRTNGPTGAKHDTDRDGMPDAWETAHGLDPADATDGSKTVPKGASEGDRHAGYTWVEYFLNDLADKIVAATAQTCTVEVGVQGEGLVVCEHGGRTANWRIDPKQMGAKWRERARRNRFGHNGRPVEVDWGKRNVFNKGSTVVLKALPQKELGVGAPAVSEFSHWAGGKADGADEPVLRLVVDSDLKITAHFLPLQRGLGDAPLGRRSPPAPE